MKIDLVVCGYIVHDNKVLLIHHKKLDRWLPPGGHIDANETPDQALEREIKEELNLDIEIMHHGHVCKEGVAKQLANPFHVNVHNVGDHDHCCFFYICKPKNIEDMLINKNELNNYKWFSIEDLDKENILVEVKNVAMRVLKTMNGE